MTTAAVGTPTSVAIAGTYNGVATATLVVQPAPLVDVFFGATRSSDRHFYIVGPNAQVQLEIWLGGPAPDGGVDIPLTQSGTASSNVRLPAVAHVSGGAWSVNVDLRANPCAPPPS